MKILRLLITEKCNRSCSGCCNKDWDLKTLPICTDFTKFDKVLLTGGEPMLFPYTVRYIAHKIRKQKYMPIYLYTANVKDIQQILSVLFFIDGMTLTLHEQDDVLPFLHFNNMLPSRMNKSLLLNQLQEVFYYFV